MIDILMPNGNERKLAEMACRLGLRSVCFIYGKMDARIMAELDSLRKDFRKAGLGIFSAGRGHGSDIIIADASKDDARTAIEDRKTDAVYGFERMRIRDSMHSRQSGLDHVLCETAKKKGKIIIFDFSSALRARGPAKAVIMGRLMQNIRLCRKYKVKTAIASFADRPLGMRNPLDMMSLFMGLGMDDGDARKAFLSIEERIGLNKRKQSGEFIAEGIERIP